MKKVLKWMGIVFIVLVLANLVLGLISSSLGLVINLGFIIVIGLIGYIVYKSNIFKKLLNKFKVSD